MNHLSVDIETFSSVDIKKSGMYKYVESSDFKVLLFAYAVDNEPVEVADFTKNQVIPDEILALLFSANCTKHAYNAAFEWCCLSKHFNLDKKKQGGWLSQWQCTALHGLYLGLPGDLNTLCVALNLGADKSKMAEGKKLIDFFCKPRKPTKTRPETLNSPEDFPEKWETFTEYNRRDVVAEREALKQMSQCPVPDFIVLQWRTDIQINWRGAPLDMDFVAGALACNEKVAATLISEAVKLTGLDNPKSVDQLKKWLETESGEEIDNLQKGTVSTLLENAEGEVKRVLELRGELSKTSVKKYQAMTNAVCADGRVRGLLQFYGANRTGRWAGRLIQPQNLPRTYLTPLPLARELVKAQCTSALELVWGSVPGTLSQLVRTAFAPASGRVFVDADFSAIEARVIAWLSREEWRLEVFRTHGRIYEASASQMFGVPLDHIVKGRPEYALRQKGKVAELALGYQGGTAALIAMGALDMGLTEEELPDIVSRWREANPAIKRFWKEVDTAALAAVKTGQVTHVRTLEFRKELIAGLEFLTILLPSGRKLFYASPNLIVNRFGMEGLSYCGVNQTTRKWETAETYGGKLVENITQAVARDCLAEGIEKLESMGFKTVFHIHDEVVIEAEEAQGEATLDTVIKALSVSPSWAVDLPLCADGWIDYFFRKD